MGCALQPWLCHKERPPAGNGGRLRSAFREPATVARSVSRHFNAGRARRFWAPADNRRSPFSRPVAGDIGGPDLSAARAAEQDALNRHKIGQFRLGAGRLERFDLGGQILALGAGPAPDSRQHPRRPLSSYLFDLVAHRQHCTPWEYCCMEFLLPQAASRYLVAIDDALSWYRTGASVRDQRPNSQYINQINHMVPLWFFGGRTNEAGNICKWFFVTFFRCVIGRSR